MHGLLFSILIPCCDGFHLSLLPVLSVHVGWDHFKSIVWTELGTEASAACCWFHFFFFHFFVFLAICDVSWCLYCFWLAHLFLQQSRSWLPSLWLQCRVVKWIIFFKSRLISDFPSFLKLSYFALQGRFYVHISVKQFLPESLNWEPNELQKVLAFFFYLLYYYLFFNSASRPTHYICILQEFHFDSFLGFHTAPVCVNNCSLDGQVYNR